MEIPLFYPNHVSQPRRYVVDGVTGIWHRDDAEDDENANLGDEVLRDDTTALTKTTVPELIYEESIPGSASVSELDLRGRTYVLSTCAKWEDHPEILSLCLASATSSTNLDDCRQVLTELDYRPLELQPLISVNASAESDRNIIRLTLVDTTGTFVTILLTDQLIPVMLGSEFGDGSSALPAGRHPHVLKPADYIDELTILHAVTGQELQSSMIAFVNPTTAIVALCPFLLTVDLHKRASYIWNEAQCLEDMRSRYGGGSLLRSYFPMFQSDRGQMKMPATAALCLSAARNPLLDSTYCITLHSDGSLRRWKIDMAVSAVPLEVSSLDHSQLPSPSCWSDAPNAISLCARTYDLAYSIGIHIKTDGLPVEANTTSDEDGSVDDDDPSLVTSDCHLFVLYGTTHASQNREPSRDLTGSCVTLEVPNEARSLVGMSFSPTSARCSLHVLYKSSTAIPWQSSSLPSSMDAASSKTIHVVYPPNMVSMVSPVPDIVSIGCQKEGDAGSLDYVANIERCRIRSMMVGPSLLTESDDDDPGADREHGNDHSNSLESILHQVDSWYMKHLFRPIFPRGNGTVLPPSVGCIRRALAKTVRGSASSSSNSNNKKEGGGMSLELETVRTMYEWRQRDRQRLAIATKKQNKNPRANVRRVSNTEITKRVVDGDTAASTSTTPFSLYDALAAYDESDNDGEEMEVDVGYNYDNNDDDWDLMEKERSDEVEAHEMRWRRLLLQIWEEEQVTRTPLTVKWLSSQPLQVLVRLGLTTVTEVPPNTATSTTPFETSSSWEATLDILALKILGLIESDKHQSASLYALEHNMSMAISKADLALRPPIETFVDNLIDLAQWATAVEDEEGMTDDDHDLLDETFPNLSPSQLVKWIQKTPSNTTDLLPGLELIERVATSGINSVTWSQLQVADYQLRHSASTVVLRCIDSVRRLQLSRSLLLLFVGEGGQARDAALRAYLHAIAVLWTSSQRIPMPHTAFQSRKSVRLGDDQDSTSPPNKRLSFGDDATSILAPVTSKVTTTIDAIAIEVSQTMDVNSVVPVSLVGVSVYLARAVFGQVFSSRDGDMSIGKPALLPELGALPRPKDDGIATDYPRLALRLLSPYVAYPLDDDSADVVLARKESLAECLLIESHVSSAPVSTKAQMRQIACEMLVPDSPSLEGPTVQASVRSALAYLQTMGQGTFKSSPVSKEMLVGLLQSMIPNGTVIEIRRLCELETVKRLFSPIAAAGTKAFDHDVAIQAAVSTFAEIMLHVSRITYRLTILERHVRKPDSNEEGENPDVVISFISSALTDMANMFPDEVCGTMPEYGKMWSRLFNHSILARKWKTAYSACVRNPRAELRASSFKRLIRAMVDQGSLNVLLLLCAELGQRISQTSRMSATENHETVDLYELASDVLAESAFRDWYSIRASSADPLNLSDYQGALYALHTSQKQWRRAAQSMDMRYVNAKKAFDSGGHSSFIEARSSEVRDDLIVEDLVLASISALNAMELVRSDAHKFLVSGEYGQYINIPADPVAGDPSDPAMPWKRSRSPEIIGEEASTYNEDRLSKFMTSTELWGRAIRSIALRALYLDRAVDPSVSKVAFLREIDSSKPDIDNLFSYGYFHYGLLLAMAWTKNREADTGSRRPEGNDLFIDSLLHMLEAYLIPLALSGPQEFPRPSLAQLENALDSINLDGGSSSNVVAEKNSDVPSLESRALIAASMTLVRNLTVSFTRSDAPVALEVASMFLNNGSPSLPAWLEGFIMGSSKGAPSRSGLFAPRRSPGVHGYLGDPAGLLRLYTEHGFLTEACMVVSTTLTAVDSEGRTRTEKASSRLPEKGDIDFVPYRAIDILWNLSEIVLSKRVLSSSEQKLLETARVNMMKSLEEHFSLASISEAGMRSSRALRS